MPNASATGAPAHLPVFLMRYPFQENKFRPSNALACSYTVIAMGTIDDQGVWPRESTHREGVAPASRESD
jgi:hypothetical protein